MLVYLAFGSEIYQAEAFFSISSALAMQSALMGSEINIKVFTDCPEFYNGLPVALYAIPSDWYGPHDYHFRLKHCVLRHVLNGSAKAVLIDTDTFFKRPPEELFLRVSRGALLCNAIGSLVSDLGDLNIVREVRNRGYVGSHTRTTNSGVIGLVNDDVGVLDCSISLMDELRPEFSDFYTLEEFSLALSAGINNLDLKECTDVIHHYWSRKEHFRAKILAWIAKHKAAPCSDAARADLLLVNDRLPKPDQPLRAIQKVATLFVNKKNRQFFRELIYGCSYYSNEFDRAASSVWWGKALDNLEKRLGRKITAADIEEWRASNVLRVLSGGKYDEMFNYVVCRLG